MGGGGALKANTDKAYILQSVHTASRSSNFFRKDLKQVVDY